jgi:hypothetical protein
VIARQPISPHAPARNRPVRNAGVFVSISHHEHNESVPLRVVERHGLFVFGVAVVALAATTMLLAEVFNESSSPGPSWVRAGSVSEIQRRQVVYVPEARVFVVAAS